MKLLLVLGALAFVATVYAENDHCYNNAEASCNNRKISNTEDDLPQCNALYSGFSTTNDVLLSKYANELIHYSYHYLLLSKAFSTYKKNRPGFAKLYKSLADDTWNDGIHIMQHITKRGGTHDFNTPFERAPIPGNSMEVSEIVSLSLALDLEKKLATEAHRIHQHYSHVKDIKHYDPEIAHYMEEKFIGKQAENVRLLSGYTNELKKMMDKGEIISTTPLSLYLFDQYLSNQ